MFHWRFFLSLYSTYYNFIIVKFVPPGLARRFFFTFNHSSINIVMPSISKKGLAMPSSPIRKLVPFSEEAKKKGRIVYHLNIGQPDIDTPKIALDAIKNIDLKVIEYSHSAGNESYRRKLAAYYQKLGLPVQTEDVMITTGGSEALLFAIMSCLDEGL